MGRVRTPRTAVPSAVMSTCMTLMDCLHMNPGPSSFPGVGVAPRAAGSRSGVMGLCTLTAAARRRPSSSSFEALACRASCSADIGLPPGDLGDIGSCMLGCFFLHPQRRANC